MQKSATQIVAMSVLGGVIHFVLGTMAQNSGMNYTPSVAKSLFVVAALIAIESILNKKRTP